MARYSTRVRIVANLQGAHCMRVDGTSDAAKWVCRAQAERETSAAHKGLMQSRLVHFGAKILWWPRNFCPIL